MNKIIQKSNSNRNVWILAVITIVIYYVFVFGMIFHLIDI